MLQKISVRKVSLVYILQHLHQLHLFLDKTFHTMQRKRITHTSERIYNCSYLIDSFPLKTEGFFPRNVGMTKIRGKYKGGAVKPDLENIFSQWVNVNSKFERFLKPNRPFSFLPVLYNPAIGLTSIIMSCLYSEFLKT